jgi:hypothetical protein
VPGRTDGPDVPHTPPNWVSAVPPIAAPIDADHGCRRIRSRVGNERPGGSLACLAATRAGSLPPCDMGTRQNRS